MTFTVHDPVAPGTLYSVADVAGHPPVSVMDFVGQVEFHIVVHGELHRVAGTGVPGSLSVLRFYEILEQTGLAGPSKLQVWNVSAVPGDGVMAYRVD